MRFAEGFNEVKVVVFLFLLFFGVKKSWNGGIFDRFGERIVKDCFVFVCRFGRWRWGCDGYLRLDTIFQKYFVSVISFSESEVSCLCYI